MTEQNNSIDILKVQLPKWPCLLVVGDDVTTEQAKQIILRTERLSHVGNDRHWNMELQDALEQQGMQYEDYSRFSERDLMDQRRNFHPELNLSFGCIPLEYLNNDRINSSWIGGPHGWCDWDGRIHSCNYNIGKWPSAFEVMEEWKKIAMAFPFLNLTCQLLSGETCETGTEPVIEYRVRDGLVSAHVPEKLLVEPDSSDNFLAILEPHRCDVDRPMILGAIRTVFAKQERKHSVSDSL